MQRVGDAVTEHDVTPWPATHLAEAVLENCELCGHLMPEGCIGWCPDCPSLEEQRRREHDEFEAWGGWRRAFGEYTDEEWAAAPATTCGRRVTLIRKDDR